MMYFLLSLTVAVLGIVPVILRGKLVAAAIQGVIGFFVIWAGAYGAAVSTAYPFFGYFGLMLFAMLGISAITGFEYEYSSSPSWTVWPPVFMFALLGGSYIAGSAMFNSHSYATMIGSVEERVWTQDIQPKDPKHMRMANSENATYQAMKVLGEQGAIGSQFNISAEHMTLQAINGKLWFIVPLDYTGFSVWTSTAGVPGYIKVSGEDPHAQPETVMLPDNQRMVYMPGAYFGYNLERHLRNSGYLSSILADWTFEIDEEGKPWWVVTVAKPTIMWSGEKVTGVVLLDPVNGATQFYEMGKVPDWVDRAVPASYISNYLSWQGMYFGGWWNSWWGKTNLTEPETPSLIYGSDGQPEFVTGITSTYGADNSLIALVYTNSRTGKSVRYTMKGGATDSAVLEAVDKNSQVQFRHLHGVDPQLYNIDGISVAVVPLLNEAHAFQGAAMVPINDVQTVAVGSNQYEALRDLEGKISEGGQRMAIEQKRDIQVIEGVVDRFASEIISNGTIYYIHLKGVPHLFTAKAGESVKLPVTSVGDRVRIEYYESSKADVPTKSFDNLSIQLSESPLQKSMKEAVRQRQDGQDAKEDAASAVEELKRLPPEELRRLKKQLNKK